MQKRNLVMLGTLALAIALGSGMARAQNQPLYLGGNYNGGIDLTGGLIGTVTEGGGSIGPSTLNGVALPWVYCVDIPDTVYVPGSYPDNTVTNNGMIAGSLANSNDGGIIGYTAPGALATVTNAIDVAWLVHAFAAGATTYDQQVGLQAAIWNQIYGVTLTGCSDGLGCITDYNQDLAALAIAKGNGLPNYIGNFDWLSPAGANNPAVDQGLITEYVPDGGMTLMLLGGALVGIGGLRRKFRV